MVQNGAGKDIEEILNWELKKFIAEELKHCFVLKK